MASYNLTITTTPGLEKGLDFKLARVNAMRNSLVPPLPPLTKQEYLQDHFTGFVQSELQEYRRDLRDRVDAALEIATPAKVTQVATALGIIE